MKSEKILYTIVTVLVIASLGILYWSYVAKKPVARVENFACVAGQKFTINHDKLLYGVVAEGEKMVYLKNYYSCNPFREGDLVEYQFAPSYPTVVKIIRAVQGDTIELVEDNERKAWNLRVNGKKVPFRGGAYFFGSNSTPPPLAEYIKKHKGRVHAGDVIVLSAVAPGITDSGIFGPVSKRNIVGKVEVVREISHKAEQEDH